MKNYYKFVKSIRSVMLFSLIFTISCISEKPETITVSETIMPTYTKTIPSIRVPTKSPSIEPTSTSVNFPTYEPISQEEMIGWLDEKLSKPECDLPCLWGITPGKSTIQEAYQAVAPIATFTTHLRNYPGGTKSGFLFAFETLPISPGDPYYQFGFDYIGNEIVFLTMSDVWDYPTYSINHILEKYGPPEEIWMEAWSPDPGWDNEPRGSTFIIYYPSQQFLLKYSQSPDEQIITENDVICCLNRAVELEAWSAQNAQEIDNFYRENVLLREIRPFLKLQDVNGMSPEDFYDSFVNTSGDVCVETPLDTWLASKSGEFD